MIKRKCTERFKYTSNKSVKESQDNRKMITKGEQIKIKEVAQMRNRASTKIHIYQSINNHNNKGYRKESYERLVEAVLGRI